MTYLEFLKTRGVTPSWDELLNEGESLADAITPKRRNEVAELLRANKEFERKYGNRWDA